jgi:hypothetical protein
VEVDWLGAVVDHGCAADARMRHSGSAKGHSDTLEEESACGIESPVGRGVGGQEQRYKETARQDGSVGDLNFQETSE